METLDRPLTEGGTLVDDQEKPAGGEDEAAESACLRRDDAQPKPEDLVARAIVPVKAEYLRPSRSRPSSDAEERKGDGRIPAGDGQKSALAPSASVVVVEKKSKRQLKRERQQEQKSARNICPEIAKTGKVEACRFGVSCRFSHDLESFLDQKPEDLPGVCPFLNTAQPCPYGIACRLFGTHKQFVPLKSSDDPPKKHGVELNYLNKDFQRLLWKNRVKEEIFLKAKPEIDLEEHPVVLDGSNDCDDATKGATCHSAARDDEGCPDICSGNEIMEDDSVIDDPRPPKKAKSPIDDNMCSTEVNNGPEEKSSPMECKETQIKPCSGTRVELIPELNGREKKLIDFRGKLYLAPLTTVGNLPFRRVCKGLGADITCGEMAMCTNLLQGQASEWALLRRHQSEDTFGVQICGSYPDTIARTVEIIERECTVDFIDVNMGCPIDVVVNKGAGSSLLTKPMRMKNIVLAACGASDVPLTLKVRTGYFEGRNRIDSLIANIAQWGPCALTVHGRSRQQRYSKLADWDYIYQSWEMAIYLDWNKRNSDCPQLSSCMVARGALIKPWIFTEIKEKRHWDISSGERLGILRDFVNFGLEHWGSDNKGVETTRHFLLEWLSYTHRYVPVGLLEVVPQRINWRPPSYFGRDDLETMMASDSAADWIRISEMLLGKVPAGFTFAPKHKSNAYDRAENG
ncbi:unnamed protein product [Spirodela intermedia]|uniref:tRNA-dihydrouridine(47) synthase [NAD(P)(+)] n=1 Tax=Spirodela intermedia TaxID=51605 RepID=A0A7I8J9B5_SPIIN|nr:unnamed protein product [Spirodela intermedia]CAA6666679.1 unnamed protein product [Spirodela intermedia]